MVKQLIITGAFFYAAVEMTHAACIDTSEEMKVNATIEKAEKIKEQIDDSKSSYVRGTFKGHLELLKSTLQKASAPTLKPGPLCEAIKKTLASSTEQLRDRAKSSGLSME